MSGLHSLASPLDSVGIELSTVIWVAQLYILNCVDHGDEDGQILVASKVDLRPHETEDAPLF